MVNEFDKLSKAIITATGRNPELTGCEYPFSLFEYGDFSIPLSYMKDLEEEKSNVTHSPGGN
jgi:hypothetical protein